MKSEPKYAKPNYFYAEHRHKRAIYAYVVWNKSLRQHPFVFASLLVVLWLMWSCVRTTRGSVERQKVLSPNLTPALGSFQSTIWRASAERQSTICSLRRGTGRDEWTQFSPINGCNRASSSRARVSSFPNCVSVAHSSVLSGTGRSGWCCHFDLLPSMHELYDALHQCIVALAVSSFKIVEHTHTRTSTVMAANKCMLDKITDGNRRVFYQRKWQKRYIRKFT